MRRHVGAASKDDHRVDRARFLEVAHDGTIEDARRFGVIDRDRHDLDALAHEVRGHVVRGLIALRFGLDPEHGHALQTPREREDAIVGGEDVWMLGRHVARHTRRSTVRLLPGYLARRC